MKTTIITPFQYLDVKNDYLRLKQPLGPALLKQNSKHEVEVIDSLAEGYNNRFEHNGVLRVGLDLEAIAKKVEEQNTGVIGLSSLWSANRPATLEIANYLKLKFPNKPIVLGGVDGSFSYEEILKSSSIDYVAIREATTSFDELLDFIGGEKLWTEVSGMVRLNNGVIEKSKPTKTSILKDLNPIDYRLFPAELYGQQKKFGDKFKGVINADLVTSLGCPHACDYCSTKKMWPGIYRTMSSEQMDFMLDSMVEEGYDFVSLQDDNFAINKRHVEMVAKKLAERNLSWHWEGGVEINLLPNVIDIITDSTCQMVDMAIETMNRENAIYDKFTQDSERKLLESLVKLKEAGIFVNSNFMLGLPGQSKENMIKTVNYANYFKENGLIDNANFHLTMAYPGTEIAKQPYEKPTEGDPADYFGYSSVIGNVFNLELTRSQLIDFRNAADIKVNGLENFMRKREGLNRY